MPLAFQPGSEWNYGVSTDVLGRLVEVVSGMPLDEFFRTRIFEPLGMTDTGFYVPDESMDRFATLYVRNPATGEAVPAPGPLGRASNEPPAMLGGGGGLVGTAHDYLRFAHMLLNRGELDGVRLLGSRTVDYMTRNHLPGNVDLELFGRPLFAETSFDGVGFGLGFSVVLDAAANKVHAIRRRVLVGRRGQHDLLGRSGAGDRGAVPHPAPSVEHLPDPLAAQPTRPASPRRLSVTPGVRPPASHSRHDHVDSTVAGCLEQRVDVVEPVEVVVHLEAHEPVELRPRADRP